MSYLGKNIKKIRTFKKMSQAVFAEQFNLNRGNISAYEEGRAEAKIDTVIEIAQFFGITVDMLLTKELTINEITHFNRSTHNISQKSGNGPEKQQSRIPIIYRENQKEYRKSVYNKGALPVLTGLNVPLSDSQVHRAFEHTDNDLLANQHSIYYGDLLIAKKITPSGLPTEYDKQLVVIVTKNYLTTRFIQIGNDNIAIVDAKNRETTINRDDILEFWQVVGIYSRVIPQR